MKKAIIVDLDGTLANVDHRRKYADAKDFGEFYKHIPEDKVNQWCLDIINAMKSTHGIIIVSGRESTPQVSKDTRLWLMKHVGVQGILLMREWEDHRPDNVVKKEIYETYIKPFYEVSFVIDDRKKMVDMWRSIGLVCLDCANFEGRV